MKNNGFSLIELLVVIGIVGVLLTFASVSYDSMQKKARDTRRKDDIKKIQTAFEQYFAICGGEYPNIPNEIPDTITCTASSIDVLTDVPGDPNGGRYQCSSCDGTGYSVTPTYETNESFSVSNQQ